VDETAHLDSLIVDLAQLGDVTIERNRGIVALVGAGLARDGMAMSRALAALAGITVHMLSLSASGINLTIIIDGDRVAPAMQALHATFFDVPANA
jgi:aspartate kinase